MQQIITPLTCKYSEGQQESLETTASLLTQSVDDLRLAERIKGALRDSGYGALRVVEVTVTTRIVILIGRVPSYYLKQVAQVTALSVTGTHYIRNGLDVVRPS